jgi:hypothetical protein
MDARWSLESGRTVDLRLVESPGPDQVHPFKKFTRKRGGHAGQLFKASIVATDTGVFVYQDDVMLAGWGESHDKGQWVRFWLDEEADRHPFAGLSRRQTQELGQFLMVVLVAIDDEGKPVDLDMEDKLIAIATHPKRRSLAQDAHLIIYGVQFQQWLREKNPHTAHQERRWDGEDAKRWVKRFLGIESLSDLDRNAYAAQRFHKEIRIPFSQWNRDL